ncbi:MAG TPA: hypothetical protein VJR92_07685 [Gemmatimonadaceae bacterium]|nr:hypothetical protein [Gemmatimonadaceae bacterium]
MNRATRYKALLYSQLKYQRIELTILSIVAGGVPALATWRALGSTSFSPMELLSLSQIVGVLGSTLAALVGCVLALRPYSLDALTNHTYAMSLPVSRTEYGLLRVGTGLLLLLMPAAGFLIGAVFASTAADIPAMLHAYPVGITMRFVLAAATAFALAFGIQYGLGKRATRWILFSLTGLGAVEIIGQLVTGVSLTSDLWTALGSEASPLRVFASNWMLFDV